MKMNLPNKLTMLRILLIPVIMLFYMANFIPLGYGKIVALVLFIIASLTDLLDGKIARKYNLVTDFGKLADTTADKLLTFVAVFMFMVDGTIPQPYGVIFATVILMRDLIVQSLRSICASKGKVVAADMIGKVKMFVSTIAYPIGFLSAIFTAFSLSSVLILVTNILFYVSLGATAVLTILSGIHYIIKCKFIFEDM